MYTEDWENKRIEKNMIEECDKIIERKVDHLQQELL